MADDDLDIRRGGFVAVDTDALQTAASRYRILHDDLADAAHRLRHQSVRLDTAGGGLPATILAHALAQTAALITACADEAAHLADTLRLAAEMYELVELRAAATFADASSGEKAARGRALAQYAQGHPEAAAAVGASWKQWRKSVLAGLLSPANGGAVVAMALAGAVTGFGAVGGILGGRALMSRLLGTAHRMGDPRLTPESRLVEPEDLPAVTLHRLAPARAVASPVTLADAVGRLPGETARIRIETYTMPDGTARYGVYLAGTRAVAPSDTDPWDGESDLALYTGTDAAAYTAVQDALNDAGVPHGAELYVFGHSLGGMIADRLAVSGDYRTRLLVTAGSPTSAAVGPGTVSVELRHTDDLVGALADGGFPQPVGADGSLVVQRAGDPAAGVGDLTLAAHQQPAYRETARLLDASTDPRVGGLRERLGELSAATAVTAVEYDARRAAPITPPAHVRVLTEANRPPEPAVSLTRPPDPAVEKFLPQLTPTLPPEQWTGVPPGLAAPPPGVTGR